MHKFRPTKGTVVKIVRIRPHGLLKAPKTKRVATKMIDARFVQNIKTNRARELVGDIVFFGTHVTVYISKI